MLRRQRRSCEPSFLTNTLTGLLSDTILPRAALMGVSLMIPLLPFFTKLGSPLSRRKVVDCLPWRAAHHVSRVVDDMNHATFQIYQHKKNLLEGPGEVEDTSRSVGDGLDLITQLCKPSFHTDDIITHLATQ